MRCKKVQELLLTDYSDGVLSDALRQQVLNHLQQCQQCRRLAADIQEKTIEPFKRISPVQPPDEVWYGIQQTIAEKQQYLPLHHKFINGLYWFLHPKPVLGLASAVAVAIIIVFVVRSVMYPVNGQTFLEEQMNYIISLDSDTNSVIDDDFGTNIEEYFL